MDAIQMVCSQSDQSHPADVAVVAERSERWRDVLHEAGLQDVQQLAVAQPRALQQDGHMHEHLYP